MSIWMQAQNLPHESVQKIHAIYGEHFPIEVRHVLAKWLEEKIWAQESEDQRSRFVEELVQQLQKSSELLTSQEMFVTKLKLLEAAKVFRDTYSHAPLELYSYFQRCLDAELQVIRGYEAANPGHMPLLNPERKFSEVLSGIENVKQSVLQCNEEIRNIESHNEAFSLQYHECMKHRAHMQYLPTRPATDDRRDMEMCLRNKIETLEVNLSALVSLLRQSQINLAERLKGNITTLHEMQRQVLDVELIRWKREQQLSGNGVQMTLNLNHIQNSCEHLAELIWLTRQQVKDASRISSKLEATKQPTVLEMLEEMSKQVTSLLSTLVTSTFVIEKQPPQVMKTNTRFTANVRLLVGGQLNVYMTPPQVKVIIISESQAQTLLKSEARNNKPPIEVCGEILNNTGCMEYQQATKQLSVSFRNMQLRKIKRAEKKGTESVMDEKLTLLFQSQFNVGGGELVFQVWTLSLPVVVIVHGNQEPHGWATVTWDNAFSEPGRIPFAVPDKVTWGQMADTLRLKFASATGRDLSAENLRFLAEKIFKVPLPESMSELNKMLVSWSQFCKDPLPERNFTFWEWFYMVVKVTRDYLRTLWGDGLIMGFIQKKQAEDMLAQCPPGTFLLRFSDSEPGGITIAWVGNGSPVEVYSLQPFTSRDLVLRSLADRVLDLPNLLFLYPDTPKDSVFSKYYTKPESETLKNGYVKPLLVTHLPFFPRPYPGMQYNTSSPPYMQSPDSQRDTPSVHSSCMTAPTPTMMDYSSDIYEELQSFDPDFENLELEILSNYPGMNGLGPSTM